MFDEEPSNDVCPWMVANSGARFMHLYAPAILRMRRH